EKPYLLGEVFPALLNGLEPPASPEVWELSRFAAVDLGSPTRPPSGQLSSPIAVELLRQAVACAERLGAKRVVTVSPVGVERLLKKMWTRISSCRPAHDCRRLCPVCLLDRYGIRRCVGKRFRNYYFFLRASFC